MGLEADYYRADQEWLIARSKALLRHADMEPQLRKAQADVDTEELCRDRLEKLIAMEEQRAEATDAAKAALVAIGRSHAFSNEEWERIQALRTEPKD